jgi:hypothetical protein
MNVKTTLFLGTQESVWKGLAAPSKPATPQLLSAVKPIEHDVTTGAFEELTEAPSQPIEECFEQSATYQAAF